MQERLEKLSDEDLAALSEYYASGPSRTASAGSGD
jgi:cytochrome c553